LISVLVFYLFFSFDFASFFAVFFWFSQPCCFFGVLVPFLMPLPSQLRRKCSCPSNRRNSRRILFPLVPPPLRLFCEDAPTLLPLCFFLFSASSTCVVSPFDGSFSSPLPLRYSCSSGFPRFFLPLKSRLFLFWQLPMSVFNSPP